MLLKNYGLLLHNIKVISLENFCIQRWREELSEALLFSAQKSGLVFHWIPQESSGWQFVLFIFIRQRSLEQDIFLYSHFVCPEKLQVEHSFCSSTISMSLSLLLTNYLHTMILMSRWIICSVIDGLHPFLPLKNHNVLAYQQTFHSYFHWNTSTTEKKKKIGWTGSLSSLKNYITTTIWGDLCGTADGWGHKSTGRPMMHVCHVLWQKKMLGQ